MGDRRHECRLGLAGHQRGDHGAMIWITRYDNWGIPSRGEGELSVF